MWILIEQNKGQGMQACLEKIKSKLRDKDWVSKSWNNVINLSKLEWKSLDLLTKILEDKAYALNQPWEIYQGSY